MTKKSTTKKLSFDSALKEVPKIHEVYIELIKKGFTTQQAYDLTKIIVMQVLK